jgi:hypothetical protein
MDRRVYVRGKAKRSRRGAVAKASLKMAFKSLAYGPKPRDLPMARLHPE